MPTRAEIASALIGSAAGMILGYLLNADEPIEIGSIVVIVLSGIFGAIAGLLVYGVLRVRW